MVEVGTKKGVEGGGMKGVVVEVVEVVEVVVDHRLRQVLVPKLVNLMVQA